MRNLALPISGDRHDTRSLVLPWHLATLLSYPPSLLGAAKESDERSVDIIQLTGQLNVRVWRIVEIAGRAAKEKALSFLPSTARACGRQKTVAESSEEESKGFQSTSHSTA